MLRSFKLKIISVFIMLLQLILHHILVAQGNYLRSNVQKLPEAYGKRTGQVGCGKKINLLILGDSSACGVGVRHIKESLSGHLLNRLKQNFSCRWKILAKSGATTDDLIKLIENDPKTEFDFIILSIGINDITAGKSPHQWDAQMNFLKTMLIEKYKVSHLIFCGIPPIRKLNQIPNPLRVVLGAKAFVFDLYLQELCRLLKNSDFVKHDFEVNKTTLSEDGFHPNSVYYCIWAQKISKYIVNVSP